MNRDHTITLLELANADEKSAPRTAISSIVHLETTLARFSEQRPMIIELASSTGPRLQLGVGGQFACAQFIEGDNMPPYLCAKARTIRAKEDVEFLLGGTPTPIAPEQCLSFEEALGIAKCFFESGKRDPSVEWVEF
jgi:hypothetical protein